MKKTIPFLFYFLSTTLLFAQPAIEWQKSLGGSTGIEYPWSVLQTADSGYIVAGYSGSDNGDIDDHHDAPVAIEFDYWIVKLTNAGVVQWKKSFGGQYSDEAYCIKQTPDGGYIVAGTTESNDGDVTFLHGYPGSDFDAWIVKLSGAGTIEWQKSYGGLGADVIYSIDLTSDGGYIVAAYTWSSNNGDVSGYHGTMGGDYWIVKLSDTGVIQWQKCYGGTDSDEPSSIQQTTDGGYIIAGVTYSNNGDVSGKHGTSYSDNWIVKLDTGGVIQWQKCLGGTDAEPKPCVRQTLDGGYLVAGSTYSNNGDVTDHHGDMGSSDIWAVKLNSSGAVQWKKCYGGSGNEGGLDFRQLVDGSFVFVGNANSSDGDLTKRSTGSVSDVWVFKTDSLGEILWQKCYGGSNHDWGVSIFPTYDNGFVMTAASESTDGDVTGNHGYLDYWIVKLGPVYCSAYFSLKADTTQAHHYIATKNSSGKGPLSYDWSWGDGTHDYTPYPSHTYADSGFYDICLSITDTTGCQSTFCDSSFHTLRTTNTMVTITVFNPLTTGTKEVKSPASQISIYPNPANDRLFINTGQEDGNSMITIFNMLGEIMYNEETNRKPETINCKSFPAGIYFVQVSNEKSRWVGKFIKE